MLRTPLRQEEKTEQIVRVHELKLFYAKRIEIEISRRQKDINSEVIYDVDTFTPLKKYC